jgi:hypothetical protein
LTIAVDLTIHGYLRAAGVGPFLGAEDGHLLLSLADEEDAFAAGEFLAVLGGDIVLTLALFEGHDRDLFLGDEIVDLTQEGVCHFAHERR